MDELASCPLQYFILILFVLCLGRSRIFSGDGVGMAFWDPGRGFPWVGGYLAGKSVFCLELGKIRYIAGAPHNCNAGPGRIFIQFNNVGKQTTQSRLDARNKPIILNNHFGQR